MGAAARGALVNRAGGWHSAAMSCPICQSPTCHGYRPFCSRRCADLDLGRWMTGAYRTPLVETDDELDELAEAVEERREVH